MMLPIPPRRYDDGIEAERNRILELEDQKNLKRGRDIELVNERLILRAPDGSRWAVVVNAEGGLSTTPV